MKVDAPLLTLLLAASAAAHPAYNATNSTSWSQGSPEQISELEKEIQSLRQQLEAASHPTCENSPSSNPLQPSSSAASVAAAGQPSGYAAVAKAQSQPAPAYGAGSSAVAFSAQGAASSPAANRLAGYSPNAASGVSATEGAQSTQYSTVVSTITKTHSTIVSTIVLTNTVVPIASSAASAVSSAPYASSSLPSNPDYYAPQPPGSVSSDVPTYTVIVTPGQSAPTSTAAYNTSSGAAHTCTETYLGTAPIPSAPAPSAYETTVSFVSLPTNNSAASSGVLSSSDSAPLYGYPNATASALYPSGSSAGSSAFATGTISFASSSVATFGSASSSAASGLVPIISANSTSATLPGTATSASSFLPTISANSSSASSFLPTISANSSSASSFLPTLSVNSSSAILNATASSTSSTVLPTATVPANLTDCSALCSQLTTFNDWEVTPMTCTQLSAGTLVNTPSGQSSVGCAASFTPSLDICQVTLNVKTSGTANTYMEVWLPNGNTTAWNGRTMSTDNGGLNGCVHYVDMQYVSGLGFAAIGDNAGHNGSSFDGTWTMDNNEAIIDWSYRARHASVDVGKQVVNSFYSKKPEYSYYIGCSAGGAQGLQSAQKFPNDFDGIIAGASANDFNHLQDWSAHFLELTGASGNDTFLTLADWTTVQSYILEQCDEALDGVNDGILEDPTRCNFNVSAIPVCSDSVTTGCLQATQIDTVEQVFKPLYNSAGELIYPALLYGAQVDAFRLGLLSGSIQGIAQDFFRGAVYNSSSFDITQISQADFTRADELDALHGNPSAFNGDLSGFSSAGKKLIMYHGMADPMTSGTNSQRYYQKVAKTLGIGNSEIDEFMRFFRISGMAHCGVGGISGAGAWMFGQSGAAAPATNNIVSNLVDWVENGAAPETMLGTKFWYDTASLGIEFERRHCRYPYRTTYNGGDSTKPESWGCEFIDDWQDCEGVTCSADGTFT